MDNIPPVISGDRRQTFCLPDCPAQLSSERVACVDVPLRGYWVLRILLTEDQGQQAVLQFLVSLWVSVQRQGCKLLPQEFCKKLELCY